MAEIPRRLAIAVAGIVVAAGWLGGGQAYGAQINAFLVPEHDEGHARFMGLRTYPKSPPAL